MVSSNVFVVSLNEVDKDDTLQVGGKAANLGEMLEAGFPVPPGFVITATAYYDFLKQNNLERKIEHLLNTINYARDDSLNQVSKHIKKLILEGAIRESLTESIFDEYEKLGKNTLVAIRSSATSEDSKTASFAGQNETFLNVRGEAVIAEKVRLAWASLFSPRSIFYRHEKKISHFKMGIALVVQKMVEAEVSGVIFTIDPVSGGKSKIVIEAVFGLGEYIVQGTLTPDHYEVDKKTFAIINKRVETQNVMLKRDGAENKRVHVPLLKRKRQKLHDAEIVALAKVAREIERHYYFPQDIEWAREKDETFIVQTRPITTIGLKITDQDQTHIQHLKSKLEHPILIGDPASPGIGTGHVRKIDGAGQISKVKPQEILVAKFTNPDFVPAMKRSAAIITEQGGRTSHAAIVARELGIPAVVGAHRALSVLNDNEIVTVNGKTGEVFKGGFIRPVVNPIYRYSAIKTATKLFVNLAVPEIARKVSLENVDGVGLLRAEFMIAEIGVHPKKMIRDGKSSEFVEKLSAGIGDICKSFYPRPVLYRTTDFKTNEYRALSGGKQFEPQEANPMLGYRGAFRYIHDPQVFKLELKAIKRVRERMGFNNLSVIIPFVRTVKEFAEVKKIIFSEGLRRSHTFKLFMMAEVPSNVILIEDFIKEGLDGISIGSNDLTMLILGVDRDNEEVSLEFDERNPAVTWALQRIISACHKHQVQVSICGQAPSVYPGLVETLVELGIDSISVSPDAVDDTRRIIYLSEGRVVSKK